MSASSRESAASAASRDHRRSTRAGEHMDKGRARMRRPPAAALLALPALLAFGRGGYFGVTRVRVAILACLLLAGGALVGPPPARGGWPPLGGGGRLARDRRPDGAHRLGRAERHLGAGAGPGVRRLRAADPLCGRV